ncbi:DEAD/DEAH box helicase [Streptomyces europaeiscabiei]|uniref:DEAD/DEAH box helicase n=1 Tax=Streptomyces europaeiscabiei TaxID=146819 RepID=UPI00099EABA8|nr:DEAD/DEAH box helicase [Streptomyces europaeiscabiei]MDX3673339.1 Helicase associated domain protein [Streptomyces europaeiscabiei]MDX3716146.1 Helicase associated domain protein [Streptomyces europaeiscabiei]MDX3839621.1 Helicase associated domain protein [Streptomyces europaeiscabiei]MDX3847843.1 Helicase associated domain protein [Streptomyces europaeiscabiei]MDX3867047.1 Helicase associated domain protein [Streptomyces europaeiscabiei]
MISLREHQAEAVSRIRKWAGFPLRSFTPAQGLRGTVVSATGSGKTITAAWAALECFRSGRILAMVPTLDLLVQTAQAWRRVGHNGPMVAVCSLEKDEVLEQLGVRTTTNPIQLALWAGHGPVVVFATYASLVDREDPEDVTGRAKVRGPLEAALAGGERLYGQTMAPFDLAVVDEAHSTAGDLGRPWAAIHDNSRIPADFRLYLTATPRILASPRPQKGTGGQELAIATMVSDPDGPYGEWLFELGLSEAVERGILAGFEIDVLEIHDPSPVQEPSEEALRGRRLALLQTALLEHAAARNLRTVMTFHQRVEEAAAFAEKMPQTAARLHAAEVSEKALADADALPKSSIDAEFYDLEAGRHVPPERVWSAWLCGDHLVAERREVLRQFADGIDAAGRRVHRAFLASVRVLGEGVDIVGERGVEAICFADTRGSQVEIVQNIGRALRPNPDGTNKTARIIVPVFLQPGEDPTDMVASASFAPLVAVLQGLRSHSERLVEQLASRALTSGQRKVHIQRDEDGRIIGTTSEGEGGQDETEGAVESALLHFSTPRDAMTIAAFLRTRVYRPESLVWLEGYQALLRWRKDNHITGLHAVPYDTKTEAGVTKAFPLGRWVHQQRRTHRAGELDQHRKELLDEAGMVWEPGDEAWETKLAALRSFHRAHGHIAPRRDAVWGGADSELVPVGEHMANLRRTHGLGKNPERAAARAAQLTAIDPDWNCPWPLDWQRHHRVLTDLATDEPDSTLPDIQPGVQFEGDDLGRWLQRQTRDWSQLTKEQQRRLSALGITPAEQPAPATAAKGTGKASAFQRGLAALAQWIQREGTHKAVPRGHIETVVVDGQEHQHKLGVWISNTKTRRDKLTHDQRTALRELGMQWA